MTKSEFNKLCIKAFGERGWQTRAAEGLRLNPSTIRRYVSGALPVPGLVEVALRALVAVKDLQK